MIYGVTIALVLAFGVSFWWDNRSLWNPILLLMSLIMGYLSIAYLMYQAGFHVAHDVLFEIGFVLIPLVIFVSGLFLIYNGTVLLRKEGYSKANLLSFAMGVAIVIYYGVMYVRFTRPVERLDATPLFSIVLTTFSFTYFMFGFAFVAFMLYSIVYVFIPKRHSYDFIIIHGAGLWQGEFVTPLLKRRIDKAVEAYYQSTNPAIKLIANGGQGADEKVSEALAIATYIRENYPDIPQSDILLEDQSTTTYENLLFSKQMGESEMSTPRFLFVTNDYHVFRTSMYARQIGMKGDGLGCSTASYYIPSAFIREYVAVCVRYKWIVIVCYALLAALLLISYRGILW